MILLFAVGCDEGPVSQPEQENRVTVSASATETVTRTTRAEACATVNAALERLETPLQLLAEGGTPVSWTDDYRDGAKTFHRVGATGPGAVGSLSEGLGDDLDRLVVALDKEQTAAARAIGDVVTNRVRTLKYTCK
ncbi:hypothetical protein [Streptomyces ortus]|uniref:Lipoprotein n=1 Tax=Streptomyces ortus TaxID=2867268 RepID=A0ABT3UYY1_9ACTN|nr:hypothetical protein [Streptomyces ortus]MCX4232794.1 hypothetical protein [Streptomyces ortus]